MKIRILIILAVLSLISCKQTPQKMNISDNEKLIQQYFEFFNSHEWTKMADLYSSTADFKDPSLGTGIVKQTKAETIKKYSELNQTFPDLHDRIVTIYPSGEKHIIVEFVSTGTAPDQTKFELPICTIFTIEEGKITKDFTYYDNFEE
jgi:ketosteroid isomerase-like protein